MLNAEAIVDALLEVKKYDPKRLAPPIYGNTKVPPSTAIIGSLPPGYTCPGAKDCLSRFDPKKFKVVDAPNIKFRCYDTSSCAYSPQARELRWHNFRVLQGRSVAQMIDIILDSIPVSAKLIRLHEGGDFFSQEHFDAWLEVARMIPDATIYAYTKSLPFWVKRLKRIPPNFKLTASVGGKYDDLIRKHGLKSATVVKDKSEADRLGLELDVDDTHAHASDKDFALHVHGTQPAGTDAAKAVAKQRKEKGGKSFVSYGDVLRKKQQEAVAVPPPPAEDEIVDEWPEDMLVFLSQAEGPDSDNGVYDLYL